MAGVLSFQDYLGGPDGIRIEQIFPSTQKSYVYDFKRDITGWQFHVDYQTIVVDSMQFNRITGDPNFSNSRVIGSFAKQNVDAAFEPTVLDTAAGRVQVNIPANMYTGAIVPDARKNVPITIVGVTWTDSSTPPQTNTHRWAFIQCYEPGVVIGDPTQDTNFVAFAI